jgi:hypothetical protein
MKGGTGKSTKTILLSTVFRGSGLEVAVFDGDASVATTYRALRTPNVPEDQQDPSVGAVRYDMREAEEAETLVRSLDYGHQIVLHDLPGGTIGEVQDLFSSEDMSGLAELTTFAAELEYQLVVVHLITPDRANPASVQGFMNGFGDGAQYIAVLNRGLLRKGETFDVWLSSPEREAFLVLEGREIEMPAIPPQLHKFGIEVLVRPEALPHYERHLQKIYMREVSKQIQKIMDIFQ